MRDVHQVVVYNIGEIICRKTVRLQQNAFIQFVIINFNVAIDFVMVFGLSLFIDGLTDNIRFSGGNTFFRLFQRKQLARILELDIKFFVFFLIRLVFGAKTIMRPA